MDLLLFLAVGIFGQIAHWAIKWSRGQIECGLYNYVMTHKKHTVGAVLTTMVSIIALFAGSENLEITKQTLALAFFAGFGFDSAINKAPTVVSKDE